MKVARHVAERLEAVVPRGARLCVGFSGGLDSTALLDALGLAAPTRDIALSAVHVHHGLSPNADAWADFCRAVCAERGVPLSVERVRVDRSAPEGLESAARAARYAVYAERPEPFVALGHHLDDQAETVLLQLLRGTGLKGVAAMPEQRPLGGTTLFRPFLELPRAAIAQHARERGLTWIEDESNLTPRQDRNFLRHDVLPPLDARFPGWRAAAARFSRNAARADALLGELACLDGLPSAPGEPLALDARLAPGRRLNLLRAFLALNGVAMPSEARMDEIAEQLFAARDDARIRIEHGGVRLLRHRGRLHLERLESEDLSWNVAWHGEADVDLGGARGRVRFEPSTGDGLSAERAREPGWYFAPRAGGERLRIDPSRPTRTLKNLFQEHGVPEWKRAHIPLLFHGGELVWVPGIGIAAAYACEPGSRGLKPSWSAGI